jgi:hypothetical protein
VCVAVQSTEIERDGERARFVVVASDPLYGPHLEHLGYLGIGDGRFATRWFAAAPSITRYHERFAASIEQMVLQSARVGAIPWEDALLETLRRLTGTELRWWLYGSTALAVRGIDIAPGDIDLNVGDAGLAGRIFDDLLVTPVEDLDGWAAKRVGRAFHGAVIEWLSEPSVEKDDPAKPNEHGPLVADRLEIVEWRGHRFAVPPLSAQLASCERRGLRQRVELIRAAMNHASTGLWR